MHDIKFIRENPQEFDKGLKRRGLAVLSSEILDLDSKRRAAQTAAQEMLARRNQASKEIGQRKAKKEDAAELMSEVTRLKDQLSAKEAEEKDIAASLDRRLAEIPNLPAADVPDGADEKANKEVRRIGMPRALDFAAKDHADLGEALGLMDFERGAKLSGARFTVTSGGIARLHRALGQFMLDLHTREYGYTEVDPPLLVRNQALFGTGQLPKFKDDLFVAGNLEAVVPPEAFVVLSQEELEQEEGKPPRKAAEILLKDPSDRSLIEQLAGAGAKIKIVKNPAGEIKRLIAREERWLIPTAEVSLTNLVAEEILDETTLPRRYTALTACFRAEAGAAGKDTRGMLRQHQFYKVELVSIAHPDKSNEEHERMTGCAEEVLKRLGLPFRTVVLCTGDTGFSARKTYDIEVWLPGQNAYREISSCSNCGDFQARRMNARFRKAGEKGTQFVHTLNGSGLAVGRALIAVMENYQQGNGTIAVPDALKPYMGGVEVVGR